MFLLFLLSALRAKESVWTLGGILFDDLNDYGQEMLLSFAMLVIAYMYKFDGSHWKDIQFSVSHAA